MVWLALDETPLTQRQAQLAALFGDVGADFAEAAQGRDHLSQLLAGRACLLILDNVRDAAELDAFDALGPRGRLLFTTRDAGLASTYADRVHKVGALTTGQARQLLAEWAEVNVGELPAEADGVLSQSGGLPLAIAMAGAMVRGRPERWPGLLRKLLDADIERIAARLPGYPHPNLLVALDVGIEDLDAAGQERGLRAAGERYVELAVFAGRGAVPPSALAALWRNAAVNEFEVEDYADFFVDRSLATLDETGRLSLHDLQMDYVANRARSLLPMLNSRLIDGYAQRSPSGWASGPDDGYFFQSLPLHLDRAGRTGELRALLFTLDWLWAKVGATHLVALKDDYDLLPHDTAVRAVQDTLRQGAQALLDDPAQLPGQLLGRLRSHPDGEVQSLLEQAEQWTVAPWLMPLTPSLRTLDGPLRMTRRGHKGTVRSVAVSPDGRWGASAGNSTRRPDHPALGLRSGSPIHLLPEQAAAGGINRLALSAAGAWVLVTQEASLDVWNIQTGERERVLAGQGSPIVAVAVAAASPRAISATADGMVTAWDLEEWREVGTQPGHDEPGPRGSHHAGRATRGLCRSGEPSDLGLGPPHATANTVGRDRERLLDFVLAGSAARIDRGRSTGFLCRSLTGLER